MLVRHENARARRHAKIRSRVKGTAQTPRLSIFRSNKHVVCQLIDDTTGKTLTAVSGVNLDSAAKGTKTERAAKVGQLLADQALKLNINSLVFDRGGYKYHGRVKAVAEELRQKGLKF